MLKKTNLTLKALFTTAVVAVAFGAAFLLGEGSALGWPLFLLPTPIL
jgi:hypothetical protein